MKEIVLSHKIERDGLLAGAYIPRDGLEDARRAMEGGLIKVVTGPRRAGKSIFAIQLLKGTDFAYVNFDDERLLEIRDLDDVLKAINQVYGQARTLFFDEIQNVENWELFVNRLHRNGFNIVLTGSNAHLLSRELATHLTGRYVEFRILPFSFHEFLGAKGFVLDETVALKEREGLLLNCLDEYILNGGFPEVVVRNVDPRSYLSTLFESVLFKDIVRRYGVRYSRKLHDLGNYLFTNHAREYTCTSLKNGLDFRSVHTVENYISYIVETFLAFTIERFSFKAKVRAKAPRKVYAVDTGLVGAVRFKTGEDTGRLLENLVAIELFRRRKEFYCYKDASGREVDFVVRESGQIEELVQVCYDLSDYKTRAREIKALLRAADDLGCGNLTILTWDSEAREAVEGKEITVMPVWKWLLKRRLAVTSG